MLFGRKSKKAFVRKLLLFLHEKKIYIVLSVYFYWRVPLATGPFGYGPGFLLVNFDTFFNQQ